jgi:hypothetical protein
MEEHINKYDSTEDKNIKQAVADSRQGMAGDLGGSSKNQLLSENH